MATFSQGLAALPNLASFVGARRVQYRPDARDAKAIGCVVGWGDKANTRPARRYALEHGLPYVRLEDGFVRSVGLGKAGAPPLSLVLDDQGIYYDASRASRLERWLAAPGSFSDSSLERARGCMDLIIDAGLSKYNDSSSDPLSLPGERPRVLVVDQTRGDLSVSRGNVPEGAFDAMLETALAEHPSAQVLIKTHPDVLANKARGYLSRDRRLPDNARVVSEHVNPLALLREVDQVYVATSQLGFEALLLDKPVTCFGAPFYAGWGLTDDRAQVARRGRRRSIEEVFAAAYLHYARYVDPETGLRCEAERVIEHLAAQRSHYARNRGRIFCFGFHLYKRRYVRDFLRCPGNEVVFARSARQAVRMGIDSDSHILAWGHREGADVRALSERLGTPMWRMEDGFLRSVGLGSDLVAPASLVVDRAGMYYDPRTASDLERILQQAAFTSEDLQRARALRTKIVRQGISKYNLGNAHDARLSVPSDRPVVVVPGQVEDDASIRFGCVDVTTNLGLLRRVRELRPDAFIVFKPHPDVISRNRRGRVSEAAALRHCDLVVVDASLAACLASAHEVHTLTSLAGFEALLRGVQVHVYGRPFYAGWGLTHDQHPVERRTRRLQLDELVAGTLLHYPRYLSEVTGHFTTPEVVIAQLTERLRRADTPRVTSNWLAHSLGKVGHAYRGLIRAR